jgi:hypothetical protein
MASDKNWEFTSASLCDEWSHNRTLPYWMVIVPPQPHSVRSNRLC